jgi:hypothetical protein
VLHSPKLWISQFRVAGKLVSGNQGWVSQLIIPTTGSSLSLGMLYRSHADLSLTTCRNARGAGQNLGTTGKPASGKTYLSTLEQCACDFNVNPSSGLLTQADYFEPYEYDSLNGGDRDFGSSGLALLDPGTFSGGGVNRVAIAGGKNGKVYVLNADNLGGFAMGPYLQLFSIFCFKMLISEQGPVVQMPVSNRILD